VIWTTLLICHQRERVVQDTGAGGQALKLEPTSEAKIKPERLKLQIRIKVVNKDQELKRGSVRERSEDDTGGS